MYFDDGGWIYKFRKNGNLQFQIFSKVKLWIIFYVLPSITYPSPSNNYNLFYVKT